MCEYCENFYTGDTFNPINSMRRDMDIFGKIFIETYISKTDKGNPALTLGLCPSQGVAVEQQKIIRFCPMCGKELKHEEV